MADRWLKDHRRGLWRRRLSLVASRAAWLELLRVVNSVRPGIRVLGWAMVVARVRRSARPWWGRWFFWGSRRGSAAVMVCQMWEEAPVRAASVRDGVMRLRVSRLAWVRRARWVPRSVKERVLVAAKVRRRSTP